MRDQGFVFLRGTTEVARAVSHHWTVSYGVEIAEGEDDITILATCVVLHLMTYVEG